ncbi:MAG TPA: hypothetical protein VFM18_09985 [Methanosarcina sp.]|nr:hypothetical protein [Methanosarcina sp.]
MSMVTESLESYYKTFTSLQFDHGLSLTDIEQMFPFELEVYITLRIQEIERRKQEK